MLPDGGLTLKLMDVTHPRAPGMCDIPLRWRSVEYWWHFAFATALDDQKSHALILRTKLSR